jgi:hypothetical protein
VGAAVCNPPRDEGVDVERRIVGGPAELVEGPGVAGVEGADHGVGRDARRAGGGEDVARVGEGGEGEEGAGGNGGRWEASPGAVAAPAQGGARGRVQPGGVGAGVEGGPQEDGLAGENGGGESSPFARARHIPPSLPSRPLPSPARASPAPLLREKGAPQPQPATLGAARRPAKQRALPAQSSSPPASSAPSARSARAHSSPENGRCPRCPRPHRGGGRGMGYHRQQRLLLVRGRPRRCAHRRRRRHL